MAYLVVAYPELDQKDYDWIQQYRSKNDPRYFSVVEPHFTLLFAIEDIEKEDFVTEVKKQLEGVQSFNFALRVATINQNNDGEYYHEFLVPDEGYSNVVKIHDRLYSRRFKEYLRLDIDFIPHIGIGNSDSGEKSLQRVRELNQDGIAIQGSVNSIEIVEYSDGKVTTIERIDL